MREKQIQFKAAVRLWAQISTALDYKPAKAARMQQGYVDMPAMPLYPFGYDLSYTKFEYSNLHVEPADIHPGGEARVTLDVKNTGERAGVETVQLYIHEKYAPVSTPVKQLRGFDRANSRPPLIYWDSMF